MFSLEPLAGTLGADNECRDCDEDHAERFEGRLEGAVVRPSAVQEIGCRQGECEASSETLEAANDGSTLLRVLLLFGDNLKSVVMRGERGTWETGAPSCWGQEGVQGKS